MGVNKNLFKGNQDDQLHKSKAFKEKEGEKMERKIPEDILKKTTRQVSPGRVYYRRKRGPATLLGKGHSIPS